MRLAGGALRRVVILVLLVAARGSASNGWEQSAAGSTSSISGESGSVLHVHTGSGNEGSRSVFGSCPGCPEICADGTYGAPGEGCSERCD